MEQIRGIGRDPDLIRETVTQVGREAETQLAALDAEQVRLERDLAGWHAEICDVVAHVSPSDADSPAVARLADLQERIREAERRATEVREERHAIRNRSVDEDEVAKALARFDPVWEALTSRERAQVIELLVERVDYDGARGKVAVTFHPGGIREFGQKYLETEDAA